MNADPLYMARFSHSLHGVLRIMTALTFISHGTMKFFGFPAMPGPAGAAPMPSPAVFSLMGFAGMLELVGGTLVLLGLFTRPVAFLLAGEMAAAYFMGHASRGSVIPLSNTGESAYLFCFIFLWLAAAGPGALALGSGKDQA